MTLGGLVLRERTSSSAMRGAVGRRPLPAAPAGLASFRAEDTLFPGTPEPAKEGLADEGLP